MCLISGPVLTHTLSRSPDSDRAIIRSAGQHAGKLGIPVNTVNRPSVSFQDHYRFFFPQVPQVYFVIYSVEINYKTHSSTSHKKGRLKLKTRIGFDLLECKKMLYPLHNNNSHNN